MCDHANNGKDVGYRLNCIFTHVK